MLKVTIKGVTLAEFTANLLAFAALHGAAPVEPIKTKADKKADTKVAESKPAAETPAGTAQQQSTAAPAITLADLQALGSKIQGHKTKDPENGAKAVAEFKQVVTDAGATRLSDPNLSAEKFPVVKAALEKVVAKYNIV